MKFSLTLTFNPAEHQVPLAVEADKMGFHSVNMGDGLFFYDETSVDYPYSDSGARYWSANTAFLDPFTVIGYMGALTRDVRFLVNVLKLPVRQPMLVAKMCGTAAFLTNDRLSLGVGLSPWPEDFSINKEDWKTRGKRCGEMIEILNTYLDGEMHEWKSEHYEIPNLSINPVPKKKMPILVGGTAEPVLKRAARIADGFVSPNTKAEHIGEMIKKIHAYRKEYGTDNKPFEMISVATDIFDLDGHKRLRDMGVDEACVMPWMYYGGKFKSDMDFKVDAMKRFQDDVMSKMD
jgi:alkanesulfonate monooxygenase SsuD/methylene tetrahydromethanopterin reductase-like flavin-dependent oxidoreductase (luciferase family)